MLSVALHLFKDFGMALPNNCTKCDSHSIEKNVVSGVREIVTVFVLSGIVVVLSLVTLFVVIS